MPDLIYTIPVMDALREMGSCAFCLMAEKLENDAIAFIMGPAYMEEDVRMDTNKAGFCSRHLEAMYKDPNRLGLALMLHTHLMEINKAMGAIVKNRSPVPFFRKDPNSVTARLAKFFTKTGETCYICEKADASFARYVDTFLHLWNKGGEEKALISQQKGYCMPHFTLLLDAADKLGKSKKEKFIAEILPIQMNKMAELEKDIEWFTMKFDFRNKDEPWKNSKDVVPRALNFFEGKSSRE